MIKTNNMSKYKCILFDMDGTLVDTAPGIIAAIRYTQDKLLLPILDDTQLQRFLGPPLKDSFVNCYGMNNEDSMKAVNIFREYYSSEGWSQCQLYPNVQKSLAVLQTRKFKLYVATSKPTPFAKKISERLNIEQYFDDIVGSNIDNTRTKKAEVIEYILNQHREYDNNAFLMVGDKSHDIIGAKKCAIDALAVSYGYGSLNELTQEEPSMIIDGMEQLLDVL